MTGDGDLGSAFIWVLVGFDLSLGASGAKLSLLYLLAVVGSMLAVELFCLPLLRRSKLDSCTAVLERSVGSAQLASFCFLSSQKAENSLGFLGSYVVIRPIHLSCKGQDDPQKNSFTRVFVGR